MNPTVDASHEIVRETELLVPFEQGFTSRPLVGLEAEKFGVFDDGTPLRYHAAAGGTDVTTLFDELVSRFGWSAAGESEGSPRISLARGKASITLEPGSQFELSGSPHDDVHAVVAEVRAHVTELATLERASGLNWVALGFHPFAKRDDLDWVPKSRYPIMRAYFPARGRFGIDMMQRTSTVQANFDFADERDAMAKLRVALPMAIVVQAMFANSPVIEGTRRPIKSQRAGVWLDVDASRSGLLPFGWKRGASLQEYVAWALDAPMFVIKRDGKAIENTHQSFRTFFRDGLAGHRATAADWESHLNTMFPEVRLKRTLEVRSADAVPSRWSGALPAIWTGVLYDPGALVEADALLHAHGFEAWTAARRDVPTHGLDAQVGGQRLQVLAQRLIEIADGGLARRKRVDASGLDERTYLDPVRETVARGQTIGDAVLGDWNESMTDARRVLIERSRY